MQTNPLDDLKARVSDETLLMKFERAWAQTDRPSLKAHLPNENHPRYLQILSELIKIDIEHGLRKRLPLNCPLDFIPENSDRSFQNSSFNVPQVFDEILEFEILLRKSLGCLQSVAELQHRYPQDETHIKDLIAIANTRHNDANNTEAISSESTDASFDFQPQQNELHRGQRIAHFQIIEKIGTGAFSIVYSAIDSKLRRTVALKVFKRETHTRSNCKLRILREAQAAALISHDNVVPIFETGSCNGIDYIASRLVTGSTLEQELSVNQFAVSSCVEIAEKIALALSAAHSIGVIHRDLKPANIMLENGQPLVIDFGLAHLADASLVLTNEGDIFGTPSYMAPEQACGNGWQGDPRSDVYSLGAVLYRMVCQRLPFEGNTSQVLQQLLHQSPVAPTKLNPKLDRKLENIILKCMEKEPSDRYATAEELREDLQNYRCGAKIKARPVGSLRRTIRWIIRSPSVSIPITVSLLLIAFLLGTLTQLFEVRNQRDRAQLAEIENKKLFTKATADAGFLQLNRGQFEKALIHFEKIGFGSNAPRELKTQVLIGSVLANLSIRDRAQAIIQFQKIEENCQLPQYLLIKGEMALENMLEDASPLDLIEKAVASPELSEPDRHYAKGLLANDSITALNHFQNAIELEAHHHRAYRMLTIMQFTLARFDDLAEQLKIAQQLFPLDADFVLLESLRLAGQGNLEQANDLTQSANLAPTIKARWCEFNEFIFSIVYDMPYDSGLAEFDARKLVLLADQFNQKIRPLLVERGWHFPPRISEKFADLPARILQGDEAESPQAIASLNTLVEVHPEASLQNLLAGYHIKSSYNADLAQRSVIDHLVSANAIFQTATTSHSFLNEGNKFAWKGVFATSVALAINHQHEVSQYRELGATASTKLIFQDVAPRHLAVFSLVLMNFQRPDLAQPWINAWVENEGASGSRSVDAIWNLAICHRDQENWLASLETARRVLEIEPENVAARQLADDMVQKIQGALLRNENTKD